MTAAPKQIADQISQLDLDPRTAVRALVNHLAVRAGRPAPWNVPAVDELATLDSIAEIGVVHEILLDRATGQRHAQGAWYTPPEAAQFVVANTVDPQLNRLSQDPNPASVLDVFVLDPACGAGVFLVEAARRIGRRYAERVTGHPAPDPLVARHLLPLVAQDCTFGTDLDPVAVDLTKSALWLECAGDVPIEFLDDTIVCGDALTGVLPPRLEQRLADHGVTTRPDTLVSPGARP